MSTTFRSIAACAAISLISCWGASSAAASATKCEDFGPVQNVCLKVEGSRLDVTKVSVSADGTSVPGQLTLRTFARLYQDNWDPFIWMAAWPEYFYTPKSKQQRSTTLCSQPIEKLEPLTNRGTLCAKWRSLAPAGAEIERRIYDWSIDLEPYFHSSTGTSYAGARLSVNIHD